MKIGKKCVIAPEICIWAPDGLSSTDCMLQSLL